MKEALIATKYALGTGAGVADKRLSSFDKALLDAGVGNYNLVKLSSILPAGCEEVQIKEISNHIKEGSLLPTAYATISSSMKGEHLVSAIGVGFPEDETRVGVIMEYSGIGITKKKALDIIQAMIEEAFAERGWKLKEVKKIAAEATVERDRQTVSTFACIAEW